MMSGSSGNAELSTKKSRGLLPRRQQVIAAVSCGEDLSTGIDGDGVPQNVRRVVHQPVEIIHRAAPVYKGARLVIAIVRVANHLPAAVQRVRRAGAAAGQR